MVHENSCSAGTPAAAGFVIARSLRELAQSGLGEVDREHECGRQVAERVRPPDHSRGFTRAALPTEYVHVQHRRLVRPTVSEKYTTEGLVRESSVISGRYHD